MISWVREAASEQPRGIGIGIGSVLADTSAAMVEPVDTAPGGVSSLAEDVQLMLLMGGGELRIGWTELAAAALVELTLLGRLGSIPANSSLPSDEMRKLVVLDDRPTGVPILDCALELFVARGKPWRPFSCVQKLGSPVGRLARKTLVSRGAIYQKGRWLKATLWIADEQQYRATVFRLDAAWLHPDAVTDPRSGAFIDLLRNAAAPFSRGGQNESIIRWEWYPKEMRDTVYAILSVERLLTSPGVWSGSVG